MTELYKKHRPVTLAGVVGQPEAIKVLERMIKEKKVPQFLLLTGPSGCGKTTVARILKKHLNCGDNDFTELDGAVNRGIDDMKLIRQQMRLYPMGGDCRIYLIDECFHGSSMVSTLNGPRRIDAVRAGEVIPTVGGTGKVEKVFTNLVNLDRVIRLDFDNRAVIYTTKQHEFLTTEGWVEAQNLTSLHCILGLSSYHMRNNEGDSPNDNGEVQRVSEGVSSIPLSETGVLLQVMSGAEQTQTTRDQVKTLQPNNEVENWRGVQAVSCLSGGEGRKQTIFSTNEDKEPYPRPGSRGENGRHQGSEWDAPCLVRKERREWATDQGAGFISEGTRKELDDRTFHSHGQEERNRLSYLLQGRHREEEVQSGGGGRWDRAQIEKQYISRSQEGGIAPVIRLDHSTVYQPGGKNPAFVGVFTDQDLRSGTTVFYDLQVSEHPSYFVQGLPVHNCHMLTREAQSALLKALEDTPSAVYFFLCTTDPEKLLPTIKTRASQIKLKAISHGEITKLVKTTAAHEKKKVTEDVLDKLTDAAAGSARKALVLLEQVLSLDDEDERLKFLENPDAQSEGIEIARALMNPRVTWPEVAKLIKQTTEEPETIRWIVLGYFNSVLLGGGKFAKRAAQVMNCFRDDYFQTKKAGLTLSCWEAVHGLG